MGLFLVLFWCAAVALCVLRHASLLGAFSSLPDPDKFAFTPLWGFRKILIQLDVFGDEAAFVGAIEKMSLLHGNGREFRRHSRTGPGATSSGAFRVPAAPTIGKEAKPGIDPGSCAAPARFAERDAATGVSSWREGKEGLRGETQCRRDLVWYPRMDTAG